MSEIALQSDHASAMLARLLEEHKSNVDLVAILQAYAKQVQDIEQALYDLYINWGLGGSGSRLDQLGALLDEPREGAIDATYVSRMRAKVRAFRSSGTYQDVLDVFRLLNNTVVKYTSYGDASFVIDIGLLDTALAPADLSRFLDISKSDGINGQGTYSLVADASTFTLSDASGVIPVGGLGLDDVSAPGSGGALEGVFT